MNLLVLGRGETGALLTQIACERGHSVRVLRTDNDRSSMLTVGALTSADVVIDFTTPGAVLANVMACARARTNIVVGTTGWHHDLPRVRDQVDRSGIGLLYSPNFSLPSNIFSQFTAAVHAHNPSSHMTPRHYAQKHAARCGIATMMHKLLSEHAGLEIGAASVRADEPGMRAIFNEGVLLPHNTKSGYGFAESAVRAAEWIEGRRGFFDFKDICRDA